MTKNNRVKSGLLVLSATALITIATNEGFSDHAYIPVPGDVPTIGYGTTSGVKLGDRTTPVEAMKALNRDVAKYETDIKKCIKVPLSQNEFDAYVDFAYNVGPGAFCHSTLNRYLNAGDYVNACHELLKWDKFQGKPLPGLYKRRLQEYNTCMGRNENV
jgi:lysozyme